MKILVTGSSGFIGKAFCDYASRFGNEIIYYDLPKQNILNHKMLRKIIYDCDLVYHFAAMADLNESLKNQNRNFEVNIRGTYNIARSCYKARKKLIFISTCCVYGNREGIEEETVLPLTIEPYACSKVAGEYIIRGIAELNYIVARIGTVYGIGMRKELFNYIVLDSIINEKLLKINGNGKQTRQYIYIDDLIKGLYLLKDLKQNREIINLCGIEKISVLDTIQIAQDITGKKAKKILGDERYGEIEKENISIEKAEKLLNWKPEITYEIGMKKSYLWMKGL